MWEELGIAPCDDPKAIRRAYAVRLKTLDPDRDPEAFARLRRAFDWALNGADAAAPSPPASTDDDAEPAESISRTAARSEKGPEPQPPVQWADRDDIRDRALLGALDAALRRRDGSAATALYYRAAATGALSLAGAPDMLERLLAVAVDDMTLGAAAFRNLVRTAGLDAPRSRAPVDAELRQRVLARLHAEDWYDDLLAAAQQRKGRIARRRRKIARLILGRIGRHWHPRVDKTALRTWLAQYRTHEAWLKDRLDPAWVSTLEGRLRRRDIFSLVFFTLFIGGLLFQFVHLSFVAIIYGSEPLWPLVLSPLALVFLTWLLKLLLSELLTLLIPGWNRSERKKPGDAG
jgi:hypothetical protein